MAKSYEASGVNLEAGYEVVSRIKKHVASTTRPGCMGGIGAFGGMFDLGSLGYRHPVLVSGTDGVGTKLKNRLSSRQARHDRHRRGGHVRQRCPAQGAEPLLFLDYVAVGKNRPEVVESIVAGVAEGCRQAGCALVGGETAEMPGMYAPEDYDIAGFTVGAVEKDELIDGSKVAEGDVLVGIPSTGVHSNGFSLVRKIVADADLDLAARYPETGDKTLGETLLTPTAIYVRPVLAMMKAADVHGVAHITGGGFDENIPRILGEGPEQKSRREAGRFFRCSVCSKDAAAYLTVKCSISSTWVSAWWWPCRKPMFPKLWKVCRLPDPSLRDR